MLASFWKLHKHTHVSTTPQRVDTHLLDESLTLLRTATSEVSQAATEAANVLQKLQQSERRFISTIDTVDDLVVIKDARGRWILLNKWGQDLYGWYHGEFYEKTDQQLIDEYPHLRDSLEVCISTDEKAWNSRSSVRSDEVVTNGPRRVFLDVVKTPVFNTDGSRKELIIIGRDMTSFHEKNKRTKACFAALNTASDIIFIVDGSGNLYFCNDQFLRMFNINDYETIVGKPITSIITDMAIYDEMWQVVRTNQMWEGTYKTHKVTVLPVMNGLPKPIYYVCTMKPLQLQ
jgi:PAS domain S-box-containing protein